jgi:cation:H+ antiporter
LRLALGIAAFGGGLWLLVESVEGLITSLRAYALAAGLSGVLVGALVLGFDVVSTAAGASVGAAIFLMTVGLGVAGLIAPFSVRPPVTLLAASAIATALAILLAADGQPSRLDGALLLAAFFPLVAAVFVLRRSKTMAAAQQRPELPRFVVITVVGGLAGLIIGAELLVFGTQRIVSGLGFSETVFGLLIVGAAVSFEEVVLEALPAFRGFPELSVGNALGTLVFLLTGSLGVIVLARPIDVPAAVVDYHLPALGLTVLLAGAMLARGRMGRVEGSVLVLAYAGYAVGALL